MQIKRKKTTSQHNLSTGDLVTVRAIEVQQTHRHVHEIQFEMIYALWQVAVSRWILCGLKMMNMVRNNTQVGCGVVFKQCLITQTSLSAFLHHSDAQFEL